MINELSNSLADRMVNLSPEVRAFCEENSRKIAGDPPRFQTMADAWVFAVLQGMNTQTKFTGELKKTKDAFHWRRVNSDFQKFLLLKALLDVGLNDALISKESRQTELITLLERYAHAGVLIMHQ